MTAAEGKLREDSIQTRYSCARATDQAEVGVEQRVQRVLEVLEKVLEKTVAEVRGVASGVTQEYAWPAARVQREMLVQRQGRNLLAHGQAEGAGQEWTCGQVEVVVRHARETMLGRFPYAVLLWIKDARVAEAAVPFPGWSGEPGLFDPEWQVQVAEAAQEHLWQ